MSSNSEPQAAATSSPAGVRPATSKRAVTWGLILLATFNALFWLLAVQPLANRQAEMRALIASLDQQVKQKSEALARLRGADEKIASATATGDDLLASLTFERRTAFSQLLTEMGQAAQEAGVEIRETDYASEEVEGNETYGVISITANFRGSYAGLVRFLNLLDRSDAFLIVERLGARPREDTGDLQISMRIDTFVRRPVDSPGASGVQEARL